MSCTSAFLLVVALKLLAQVCHLACLASRAADLSIGGRSILASAEGEFTRRGGERQRWKQILYYTFDDRLLRVYPVPARKAGILMLVIGRTGAVSERQKVYIMRRIDVRWLLLSN